MKSTALAVVVLLVAGAQPALGQQARDGLTDQQRRGRQLMSQSCGVCHLPPARNAQTYGPLLSKASSGGDDAKMRQYILEGTPRMPAFKYFLQPPDVDAIIAYVRTLSASATAAPRGSVTSGSPETSDR